MEIKFVVPAKYLAVLQLFAAKSDMRRVLMGICLEVRLDGIFLFATDGHVYGCFRIENSSELESDTLPGVAIPTEILRGFKFDKGTVEITLLFSDIESVRINYGTFNAYAELEKQTFPNIRNVIPKVVTGKPAQFDFRLLARLEKARTILHGKNDGAVVLGYNGEDGPSIVSLGEENFTGLIMPLRGVDPIKTFPDWFLSYALGENHAA